MCYRVQLLNFSIVHFSTKHCYWNSQFLHNEMMQALWALWVLSIKSCFFFIFRFKFSQLCALFHAFVICYIVRFLFQAFVICNIVRFLFQAFVICYIVCFLFQAFVICYIVCFYSSLFSFSFLSGNLKVNSLTWLASYW